MIYQHKDGRTQQVQEREKVKISILERGGWKRVDEPMPGVASASPGGDNSPAAKEMRAEAAAKDAEVDARLNAELYDGAGAKTPIRDVLTTPDKPTRKRSKTK